MTMSAIFGAHAPLIRDYPSAPPTPPAPPAPPTPPQPPASQPIAFSAVTRDSLFLTIGSAIGTPVTLATITCADASMTIAVSESVAGLTFSYTSNVLKVSGTPTGSTRVQRIVVSYVASDGTSSTRGSTTHELTLVKNTDLLTIGSMASAAGRVGVPLSATLASPTTNYACDVTSAQASVVPGLAATLAWTRGSSWGPRGRRATRTSTTPL